MSNRDTGGPATQQTTVLVAGEGASGKALVDALKGEYEVVIAGDPEAALALLDAGTDIHLIISALDPAVSGAQLLSAIRGRRDHIASLPVLAAVDGADEAGKKLALAAGANGLATLPVDQLQLLAHAQTQVQLFQAGKALQDVSDDPLTGAASRRYFVLKGTQDVALASRHQEQVAVVCLAIDRIRKIYGEHGEEAADAVLVWASRLLKDNCRQEDTVARIGGAEFGVLAPKTSGAQALQIYERLCSAAANRPFQHRGKAVAVTFSVGIAVLGVDPELEIEGLLRLANERAVIAAKDGGIAVGPDGATESAAPRPTVPVKAKRPTGSEATIDIENALTLLAANKDDQVSPHVAQLLLRLVPLLELGNRELNLGLGFAMSAMQKRLQMILEDESLAGN